MGYHIAGTRRNNREERLERVIGFYLPVLLAVLGTLVYHIAQKTMPRAVSPFLPLAFAFSQTRRCVLLD
jgi:hypothetical protein